MALARRQPADTPKEKINSEKLRQALKIFQFIKPYRWSFIWGIVFLFFSSSIFMVFPYLAGQLVDIAQGRSAYQLTLSDVGLALIGTLIIQGVISYVRVLLFARVSERGIADVRAALYDKLISLPVIFFEQTRVGELVSRISADVEKLYGAFSITLAEFIRQIIVLLIGIVFLGITMFKLSAIMLATFPLIVVGAMVFGRYIRKLSKERQEKLADSNIILGETMQTMSAVKAFTNERFESMRYGRSIGGMVDISMRYARGRALFSVFIVTILFGALFFIIWRGALMIQNGEITAGDLVSFVAYTAIIGGAIAALGNFYTELLGAVGATERVREILEQDSEVDLKSMPHSSALPLRGDIRYRDVHFSYPTRADVPVLKGLDLDIAAGQKVALVGMSGAGKSTIVQLLLRFYDGYTGHLSIDGQDVRTMDITALRRNMAIVPQEVILFGGSIRENILYGDPGADEAAIIEAARRANAWEFISQFPEGLDTIVGERGVKLSGGQRQRIAIARAILRNPSILILDEATSSLDAESEKVVQAALNELMKDRTAIIIAHRLATIREVDQIFVIDGGRIVETGTHEELSKMRDGIYQHLAQLQFEEAKVG